MDNFNDQVKSYIIHYSPLLERLETQRKSPAWNLLNPQIVSEINYQNEARSNPFLEGKDDKVTSQIMAQVSKIVKTLALHCWSISQQRLTVELSSNLILKQADEIKLTQEFYSQALRAYSRKNHELSLQHIRAMKLFLRSGRDYCLILEDDSIPIENNQYKLSHQLKKCFEDVNLHTCGYFDISNSLGLAPNLTNWGGKKISNFVQMSSGQTRCSSSYLISRESALNIVSNSDPIVLPIDWHLSYVLNKYSIATYWHTNPLFKQGSESGCFESNQESRNL